MAPTNRIRAVILTTQRTGSTFLVECLGSHPDIESAGEILIGAPDSYREPRYRGHLKKFYKLWNIARNGAWHPARRMERFYSSGRARVRVFKAMYNQLSYPFALRYLREHEEIHVIHLRRENLLKVHVSRLLMPKRQRLQAFAPVEPIWVRVDPALAVAEIRNAHARYEHFVKLFERHPRIAISYEQLFDGAFLQGETSKRICEFLEIPQHPMKSQLVKLNPETLREMVTNYDELADVISRTEFAFMLQ